MKILLSPAKTINTNAQVGQSTCTAPIFGQETKFLIQRLKKLSPKKIAALMSVSQDIAELNFQRFQNFVNPNEDGEVLLPAILAFSGEVYRGFDAESLNENQCDLAQKQVRILSGLYGILKPFDLIYPYRLEMGTKFPNTKTHNNLYTFWGSKITDSIQNDLHEGEPLVNLASTEYSKVVNFKQFKNPVITPVFKEFKNGDYKMVMMYAKHARGEMARYIISNDLKDINELKVFDNNGYTFDDKLSNDSVYTFVR